MLSIILPTFNESANLPILLERIADVLGKRSFEVIVVDDDSPDRTWEIAEALRKRYPFLSVIRRVGRTGLSSAVVEGFDAAKGDVLLVMDSDLQHDPELIAKLEREITDGADIAVASRYRAGGTVGEWVTGRRLLSKTATWLARSIPRVEVSDPMSGFFAMRKTVYDQVRPHLRPTGFKILFEILGHLPRSTKTAEVPLVFKMRVHGRSKLSWKVQTQFLFQLLRIAAMRFQSIVFWLVCIVLAVAFLMRLLPILPLYTDASVRAQAQATLRNIADRRGWLLSDVELLYVHPGYLYLHYASHHRGDDGEGDCYHVVYPVVMSPQLPCVEE